MLSIWKPFGLLAKEPNSTLCVPGKKKRGTSKRESDDGYRTPARLKRSRRNASNVQRLCRWGSDNFPIPLALARCHGALRLQSCRHFIEANDYKRQCAFFLACVTIKGNIIATMSHSRQMRLRFELGNHSNARKCRIIRTLRRSYTSCDTQK